MFNGTVSLVLNLRCRLEVLARLLGFDISDYFLLSIPYTKVGISGFGFSSRQCCNLDILFAALLGKRFKEVGKMPVITLLCGCLLAKLLRQCF